jgi:hypothetical protein
MTNEELELRRVASQADRARLIIEDPLLQGAFAALEARFMAAWRSTAPTDTAGRESLWHHIQALAEVRAELTAALNDGLMAKARLDDLRAGPEVP